MPDNPEVLAAQDPRAKNIAFIYLPFVCRGTREGTSSMVPDPAKAKHPRWTEVSPWKASQLEELYLHSYVAGYGLGRESEDSPKSRHYTLDVSETSEGDALLAWLRKNGSEKNGLLDPARKLEDAGPICDGGSSSLSGKCLAEVLTNATLPTWEEALGGCDCWRIRKAHRYAKDEIAHGKEVTESHAERYLVGFLIRGVHLYWFRTGLAIVALELEFFDSNPFWVSSSVFHLKKVQKVRIIPAKRSGAEGRASEGFSLDGFDENDPAGLSLCNFGKLLASDFLGISPSTPDDAGRPYLFFNVPAFSYKSGGSDNGSMRANVFVYASEPEHEGPKGFDRTAEITRKLFYLSNCIDSCYPYESNGESFPMARFDNSTDIHWAASSEALACYVNYQADEQNPYPTSGFFEHVCCQYQYLYVLILHQKYYYYHLMNIIGAADTKGMEALRKHRKQLEQFEAQHAFSHISEMTQYQRVYEITREALGIENLQRDVREPITLLVEQQQRQQERLINRIGFVVGVASALSVITDVATYFGHVGSRRFLAAGITLTMSACLVIVCLLMRKD